MHKQSVRYTQSVSSGTCPELALTRQTFSAWSVHRVLPGKPSRVGKSGVFQVSRIKSSSIDSDLVTLIIENISFSTLGIQ